MWPNDTQKHYVPTIEERLRHLNNEILSATNKGNYDLVGRLSNKCKELQDMREKYDYHHKKLTVYLTKSECDTIEIVVKDYNGGGDIIKALQAAK